MKKGNRFSLAGLTLTGMLILGGCGGRSGATVKNDAAPMDPAAAQAAGLIDMDEAAAIEKSMAEGDMYGESVEVGFEAEAGDGGSSSNVTESAQATSRKLIRTVSIDAETQEFDQLRASIEAKIKELGGYVESSNINNGSAYGRNNDQLRHAVITARIPAARADEFLDLVGSSANVVTKNESSRDVTLQYVDMESREKALDAEEVRLLEMLESADTVEDMIYIEDRLSSIRYEKESIESQIRTYDNQVDYTTVTLTLSEVKVFTEVPEEPIKEPTAWERISEGFMKSLKNVGSGLANFFIGLIVISPYLMLWALIVLIIVFIVKSVIKKNQIKNAKKYTVEPDAGAEEKTAEEKASEEKTSEDRK